MTTTHRAVGLIALAALVWIAGPAAAALPIQQWQTPEGAKVLFVETHQLPMLDVAVDFPAGSSRDTPDKSGTASLTLRLMGLGVEGMKEEEISERFADVGAQPAGRFDVERAGYSVRTLSSKRELDQAVDLLARILQRPTFPEAVLKREKARALAGLREADTKPETIADRAFRKLVFGSHPYALRGAGEVATVDKLTRADLVDFYRRHYVAEAATIAIIGDISPEQARAIANRLSSGLPRTNGQLPPLPPVPPLAAAQDSRISHPASQAHILIGQPGIKRKDPDYFALWLGNHVLGGGGFSSRLNEEIRQKRGFAYSTYSYFAPLGQEGPFQIGLQTQKAQAEEALQVARDVLARFVAEGPSMQELENAKQNVIGGFALRIDSNRKILEYLSIIGFYDLPLDYLDEFPRKIEALTLAEVKDAWQRRIRPDRMVTVVVGSAEAK